VTSSSSPDVVARSIVHSPSSYTVAMTLSLSSQALWFTATSWPRADLNSTTGA